MRVPIRLIGGVMFIFDIASNIYTFARAKSRENTCCFHIILCGWHITAQGWFIVKLYFRLMYGIYFQRACITRVQARVRATDETHDRDCERVRGRRQVASIRWQAEKTKQQPAMRAAVYFLDLPLILRLYASMVLSCLKPLQKRLKPPRLPLHMSTSPSTDSVESIPPVNPMKERRGI